MPNEATKLADFIEEWERFTLESGMGDWSDAHELPDAERELIIRALRALGQSETGEK